LPTPAKESLLRVRLAPVWFVRVGIRAGVTSFASSPTTLYHHILGNRAGRKISLLYLAACFCSARAAWWPRAT